MEELTDSVVAITGASAGIGRATARELAGAGARVVVGARRHDRLEALEREFPDRIVAVEMDVRSPDDARRRSARPSIGSVGSTPSSPTPGSGCTAGILDHTDEDLTTMLDTNFAGTVWPIRAAVPEMLKAGRGDIVIVASVAGLPRRRRRGRLRGHEVRPGRPGRRARPRAARAGIRVTTIGPAGTSHRVRHGRRAGPRTCRARRTYLQPEDIAFAIRTVLEQPRRLRTQYWTIWSMAQGS